MMGRRNGDRKVHFADAVEPGKPPVALCSPTGRPINPRMAAGTTRRHMVTCLACKQELKRKDEA